MFKRLKERNFHLLLLAFFIGYFLGINVSYTASATEPTQKYLNYFHQVYQIITKDYVDTPQNKDLFYGAIQGMIKSLDDPFSRFLDEKSYASLREMTTGKFVGVGIEITIRDGEVVVISPIEDSPAMKAGILSNDIIMKVNKTVIKGKKLPEIVKLIKGLPKTKVTLFVKRQGFSDLLEFEIKRAPIKIKSVDSGIIKDNNVGYIKIKNFGSDTVRDTVKALKTFNGKKIDNVIVDLRYNPGGLLTAAIDLSDLFLEKGKIIVSTKGRKGSGIEEKFNSMNDPVYTGEMIVLVNHGSASASEIFSGAMRDNKRCKLLGEKTFGKGSVQKTFNLDKRIGVAITIAKYYTPSGEMIHKKGIKPDIKVEVKKLSKEDKASLNKIYKEKLLDKFVIKGMIYNAETKNKLKAYLEGKKIKLSDKTTNFILKSKINRYKKRALYDLEFDNQLVSAINKLNK
ncbi:MAG: S41 family peptidase [bacterium]|nr:S41 family peptidase [bacterium]